MSAPPVRAALVGAGRIGAMYAEDPATARHFRYATHAQVLSAHPDLEWTLVVDRSAEVRDRVRATWRVGDVATEAIDLGSRGIELVVIATPPHGRLELVRSLGRVRAILMEKPIADTLAEARSVVEHCERSGIVLQVALWRRADARMRALAAGELGDLIGAPLAVFGVYGNGLRNNGTHMIDLVRMLLGEVEAGQALGAARRAGAIAGDADLAFSLRLQSGILATLQAIPFAGYRENSLDIWGERGRLEILQEGLRCSYYPVRGHRAMTGQREVASDEPTVLATGAGDALYGLYDNLLAALRDGSELWSPGRSALRSEEIIDVLLSSVGTEGAVALPS